MRNMFKQLFGDGSSTDKDKKKSKKKDSYTMAREYADKAKAKAKRGKAKAASPGVSSDAMRDMVNRPKKAMPTSKEMQAKRTSGATPTMAAPGVRKAQQTKAKDLTTPTPAPANINPKGMTGTKVWLNLSGKQKVAGRVSLLVKMVDKKQRSLKKN